MDKQTKECLLTYGAAMGCIQSALILYGPTDPQKALRLIKVEVEKAKNASLRLSGDRILTALQEWADSRNLQNVKHHHVIDSDGYSAQSLVFLMQYGTVEVIIGYDYTIKQYHKNSGVQRFKISETGKEQWQAGNFNNLIPILQEVSSLPTTESRPKTRTKDSKHNSVLSKLTFGVLGG